MNIGRNREVNQKKTLTREQTNSYQGDHGWWVGNELKKAMGIRVGTCDLHQVLYVPDK